jgi:hypothetical protein
MPSVYRRRRMNEEQNKQYATILAEIGSGFWIGLVIPLFLGQSSLFAVILGSIGAMAFWYSSLIILRRY